MIQLNHYRALQIKGPDAETFIQGQTTNDVGGLSNGESQLSAHCNHKGRVISSFVVGKVNEDTFLLRMHESIIEIATAALKKYMVFSKAELIETGLKVYVLDELTTEQTDRIRESEGLHLFTNQDTNITECHCDPENTTDLLKIISDERVRNSADWDARLIENGFAEVRGDTSEQYLPQELNFDLVNGVNFKKGCYTGQEVIARLHYRGKSKKRLRRGEIETSILLTKGSKILNLETGKPLGEIVLTHTTESGIRSFLAVVNNDALELNCGFDQESGAKIQWQAVSYAIP